MDGIKKAEAFISRNIIDKLQKERIKSFSYLVKNSESNVTLNTTASTVHEEMF
jgi:hypothetical protein